MKIRSARFQRDVTGQGANFDVTFGGLVSEFKTYAMPNFSLFDGSVLLRFTANAMRMELDKFIHKFTHSSAATWATEDILRCSN